MRECFYFDDVMLGGAVLIVAGGPLSILVIRISRVNDAFKLREELCCSMIGGSTIASEENKYGEMTPYFLSMESFRGKHT